MWVTVEKGWYSSMYTIPLGMAGKGGGGGEGGNPCCSAAMCIPVGSVASLL